MTIGLMQPYFLPYLGYFQLMNAVDIFVYYDDVTYIKGGWINRNNILVNGEKHLFTLQLSGASSFKKINKIEVGNNRIKLLKTIEQNYCKAPYFKEFKELLRVIFESKQNNLFEYIFITHQLIFEYIGLQTNNLVLSSALIKNNELHGQDKVINICQTLNGTKYINAIGGQHLYSKEAFKNNGIEVKFIKSGNIPTLSILHVLMHYSKEEIKSMLNDYTLI